MKCPKCGFENRPGARFCKQCGQLLQAQAAPPAAAAPAGIICPACGATAKPGARFCPRCGKQLAAEPAPPTTVPPPAAQISTQPSMPPPPQTYAQPPSPPPPLAAPSAPKLRFPRWLLWGGTIVASLCIIALIVTAIVFGPKLLGGEEEPVATPTATEALAEELPTESATTEATTAPPPTETRATEEPPSPGFDAQVAITPSAPQLPVGELLTITVTITNTGQVPFGNLRYQLVGWEPFFMPVAEPVTVHSEIDVPRGESDTATFQMEAAQVGTAQIHATVAVDAKEGPPSTRPFVPEHVVEVSVVE